MLGKKKTSEQKDPTQKKKKPIYKRIWFWIIVIAVLLAAFGGGGDSGEEQAQEEASQSDVQTQTEPVAEETVPNEDVKADARDKDTAIYGAVLSAETKYNGLISTMDTGTDLDIYDAAKDTKDFMQTCWSKVNDQKDDLNEEYVKAAQDYFVQIQIICENIMDYLNDGKMEKLSDAKAGMEGLNTYVINVVGQRQSYLTEAGFTTEEIEEINSVYSTE